MKKLLLSAAAMVLLWQWLEHKYRKAVDERPRRQGRNIAQVKPEVSRQT
jgi:hypothetical protein